MKNEVVVLDTDQNHSESICHMLEAHSYRSASLNSLTDLDSYMAKNPCRAVILNLDSISVTNKTLKQLKADHPSTSIIAVSERQFHPELAESLREYISVCLTQPVDSEELTYWLKTVFENNGNPNG